MLALAPLIIVSAIVEIVGVAAVVPFLALLADADAASRLPIVGPWLDSNDRDAASALRLAGGLLAGVVVVANVFVIITNWTLYRFSTQLNHTTSTRLLRHYLSQPYIFFLTRNSATLTNRVLGQVPLIIDQGVRAGLEILTRSVVILSLVTFLVLLDPMTAIVSFVSLGGVYGAIFLASRRYLQRIGREAVEQSAAQIKAVYEAIGGLKDLRVAGRESSAHERFIVPSRRSAEIQAAMMAMAGLPRSALEAVAVGGLVLIASLMYEGTGSALGMLPLLGAYAFAGLRIMPAMQVLFAAVATMRFTTGALEAVEEDFATDDHLETGMELSRSPLSLTSVIELRNITYQYPAADRPALRGVSLSIERDRSLAIVGRTGSGKTTLVDVFLGLLEPQGGEIRVDGDPVTRDRIREYRRLFGYVPQSIYLTDDTVAQNVAFGVNKAEIDMVSVRRACSQAQIADFVEQELEHGYDTHVGERGVRLSGGQRQRIGIARALYHQPAVLVFDEATSALDVHTEHQVYQALAGIARERTVVTIAHRLETVAQADRVIVLEKGKVLDEGPATEVLRRYHGSFPVRG